MRNNEYVRNVNFRRSDVCLKRNITKCSNYYQRGSDKQYVRPCDQHQSKSNGQRN